jgi:hypothetical protein
MANTPVKTLSYPAGPGNQIQLAIWENEKTKDGEEYKSYSITIQRRYREGEQWKSASGFRASDTLIVAFACQQAFEHVQELKA